MSIDFEELQRKADEADEKAKEETRAAFAEMNEQKQKEQERLNSLFASANDHADEEHRAAMEREIEQAKQKAEAEVRQRYKDKYGAKAWNEDAIHNGLLDMVRSLNG